MNQFVQAPHLPQRAKALLYGEKYAKILEKPLELLNIESIFVPDNPLVDNRLSSHADLSVFHAGGERLFLAPYLQESHFSETLYKRSLKLFFPAIKQGKTNPDDAKLNACAVGNNLIYSPKASCSEIVNYFTYVRNARLLSVRQSYVKCSVCVVDSESLITADRGIARAVQNTGIKVLLISPGFVELPGFSYGFIGGASFRLSEHCMAFTGVLDLHPDKERILSFLADRGLNAVFLTEQNIFDIGSAFPILET